MVGRMLTGLNWITFDFTIFGLIVSLRYIILCNVISSSRRSPFLSIFLQCAIQGYSIVINSTVGG